MKVYRAANDDAARWEPQQVVADYAPARRHCGRWVRVARALFFRLVLIPVAAASVDRYVLLNRDGVAPNIRSVRL